MSNPLATSKVKNNKERGQLIREQIVKEVRNHPADLTRHIANLFQITPQAVSQHIRILENEDKIASTGKGKGKRYALGDVRRHTKFYYTADGLEEDRMWRNDFEFLFEGVPSNVVDICHLGFTEIVNNAIDHSQSGEIYVAATTDTKTAHIFVADWGEGIFRRIRRLCNLEDERHALLELRKGKLTTDPENHTGQGIFWVSRAFDHFNIESLGLRFNHDDLYALDLFERVPAREGQNEASTVVFMGIRRDTDRLMKNVYASFTSGPDEFEFDRTIVPVRLAEYGAETLISRSSAKRVLANLDKFNYVAVDFQGVEAIGQAFADEIFRVYANNHLDMTLSPVNMNEDVERMVKAAIANRKSKLPKQ